MFALHVSGDVFAHYHEHLTLFTVSGSVHPSFCKLQPGLVVNVMPRPLYALERSGINCIGRWVGPRAGLDGCGKSRPHQDYRPVQPVAIRYTY